LFCDSDWSKRALAARTHRVDLGSIPIEPELGDIEHSTRSPSRYRFQSRASSHRTNALFLSRTLRAVLGRSESRRAVMSDSVRLSTLIAARIRSFRTRRSLTLRLFYCSGSFQRLSAHPVFGQSATAHSPKHPADSGRLAISFDYRKTRSRSHESFEKNSPDPSSVITSSETEAKDVRAGSYDNVLLAAQHEGHGGGFHSDVGWEAPQCFARALIRGRETAVGLAVEKQPARRS
jgi:hypothetical protein